MNSFEEDRSALSALQLLTDGMRPYEFDALRLAEAMTRRCQAVLDLCADSRRTESSLDATRVREAVTGASAG